MSFGKHLSSPSLLKWASVGRAVLVSGLLSGNLATLSLLRHPRTAVAYMQYALFGWRMFKAQGLPQSQFHELFSTAENITVELPPSISYLTNRDANYAKDILYLCLITKILLPETVFEIGTLFGETAFVFALNTGSDARVFTLDLPPDVSPSLSTTIVDDAHVSGHAQALKSVFTTHIAGLKVQQLYGDSAKFDFTSYQKKVDLFFIDGAHSYEYVRSDTLNALSCMRRGGVIVWHDYGRWGVNGVSRWLHELAKSGQEIYRLPGSSLAIMKVVV